MLLELVGQRTSAASESEIVETLTAIANKTTEPGHHDLVTPLGTVAVKIGRQGELLNAKEIDPLRPLRAGLISGLPPEERATAFALIVSLAKADANAFSEPGKRDLVSLISRALGDALTRR
ncbi:MAG: hypothetical protein JNM17_34875 [Archangium sp.]|nr:hypothetical protein [Archangium sp.]